MVYLGHRNVVTPWHRRAGRPHVTEQERRPAGERRVFSRLRSTKGSEQRRLTHLPHPHVPRQGWRRGRCTANPAFLRGTRSPSGAPLSPTIPGREGHRRQAWRRLCTKAAPSPSTLSTPAWGPGTARGGWGNTSPPHFLPGGTPIGMPPADCSRTTCLPPWLEAASELSRRREPPRQTLLPLPSRPEAAGGHQGTSRRGRQGLGARPPRRPC